MQRAHDLRAAPSLVEPDIADDVADLLATVSAVAREHRRAARHIERAGGAVLARRQRVKVAAGHDAAARPRSEDRAGARGLSEFWSMICVVRRASIDSVADRPLPSCAV